MLLSWRDEVVARLSSSGPSPDAKLKRDARKTVHHHRPSDADALAFSVGRAKRPTLEPGL